MARARYAPHRASVPGLHDQTGPRADLGAYRRREGPDWLIARAGVVDLSIRDRVVTLRLEPRAGVEGGYATCSPYPWR